MKTSVLIPFREDNHTRRANYEWIAERWSRMLPDAEIVTGVDDGEPFSKAVAVNDAYSRSTGDMLVIVDADSWVERPQLETAIEHAEQYEHLVVPWMKAYRLGKGDSNKILRQEPSAILPVSAEMKSAAEGTGPAPDSCAMVLCIQRQGFERVGGFDPRFRGWGSEDVSFGLSCWTLLGRNRYCIGEAFALYHPRPMKRVHTALRGDEDMRVWKNDAGGLNFDLWYRYRDAQGYPGAMLSLCAEHAIPGKPVSLSPTWKAEDMVPMQPEQDSPDGEPVVRERLDQPDDDTVTVMM